MSALKNICEKPDLLFKTIQNMLTNTQFCHNSVVDCVSYIRKLKDDMTVHLAD